MKRMYLEGVGVRGPSLPSRCRILVASTVCSQSSMNSHRWARPGTQSDNTTSTPCSGTQGYLPQYQHLVQGHWVTTTTSTPCSGTLSTYHNTPSTPCSGTLSTYHTTHSTPCSGTLSTYHTTQSTPCSGTLSTYTTPPSQHLVLGHYLPHHPVNTLFWDDVYLPHHPVNTLF